MQSERHSANREEQVKAMVVERLLHAKDLLQGHKVCLYGSRVQGKNRPRSDFDIGILGNEALPLQAFYQLEDMMDNLPTLYKIDLVDLNRTSSEFRQQALKQTETLV